MAGSPARSRTHSQGFGAYGKAGDNQAMTRPGTASASRSKRPRHHQRELFAPERTAVRPGPLRHHNVRTRIAQRAHRVAFSRKNGSSVPATRYARGIGPGITPGGR